MELVMLLIALFVFFFGSALAASAFDYGLSMGDKTVKSFGYILKQVLFFAFKCLWIVCKFVFTKAMSHRRAQMAQAQYSVKPIYDVTPLDLQHMRNNKLLRPGRRESVLIEYPPQQN